jgi:hypothetical protein
VDEFPHDFLDHLSLTLVEAGGAEKQPSCTLPADPLPLDVGPFSEQPISGIWHRDVGDLPGWQKYGDALEAELASIQQESARSADVWAGGKHGATVVLKAHYTWQKQIKEQGDNTTNNRVVTVQIPPICTYVRGQALGNSEGWWKKNAR